MREFVAIGDTVVDSFIKLKTAEVSGMPDTDSYKLSLPFAEKIPYEDLTVVPAVGNAANAAVAAARLGLKPTTLESRMARLGIKRGAAQIRVA